MSIFNTGGRHSLHLVRWAGVVVAFAMALSVITGLFTSHPAHQATPAPAPAPRIAPAPASRPAVAPGTPHVAAEPATAPAQPAGPILLPAQQPGGTMRVAHAQIALASGAAAGPWIDLGDAIVHAPTSSFSTVAPAALRAVAPTTGYARVRWSGWIQAPVAGAYTLAMSVSGGPTQSAAMRVDGVAQPIASATRACGWMGMCSLPTSTAAGSVALAPGWHIVQVTVIAPASAGAGSQPADVTVYARAPDSGTPAVLVPSWPAAKAKGMTP